MKKFFIFTLAAAALSLTACKNKLEEPVVSLPETEDCGREKIEFSLSDGAAPTRAGFTEATTRIVARFQSDEKGGTNVRYTRTVMKAAVGGAGATDFSLVSYYTTDNTRYWDDAFGRKGQISVYAVAIPNSTDDSKLTDTKLDGGSTWAGEVTPNNSIQWDVTSGTQTSTTLAAEDLVYSNNIQTTGTNGRYVWNYDIDGGTGKEKGYPADNGRLDGHADGRLVFTQKAAALESDAGHFDKGHLMFNHALSRLTITLVEGDGFDKTSASKENDFKFTNGANIKLLQMPYTGTLNIKEGTWGSITPQDIAKLISSSAEATKADATFSAQVLPSYKFYENGVANVMTFVIDKNTYYVTQGQIFTALNTTANITAGLVEIESDANGNYIEMKQGKNYALSITVNKTKIDNVTATLAEWVNVAGAMEVNNAHITLTLKTTGATCDKDIDLYRLDDDNTGYDADNFDFSYQGKNWFGNYSTDAMHKTTLEHSALSDGKWTTPWYFESNKTYYHFRTVNKDTPIYGTGDETKDYFTIEAGPVATTDPHWGAPMRSTTTTWLKYDDNGTLDDYSDDKGYEAHLHWAIGATESQIAIQELHMMSNIEVVLETPDDGGKVQLYKPATAAVLYADAAEYNAAKGTSLDDAAFAALTDEQKTKTPAEPAVGTVIKITRLAGHGKIEMGRGLVTPSSIYGAELTMTSPSIASASDYYETEDTQSKKYTYAVVPQSLSRDFTSDSDDDYVGIFIQTPDHNQYYVVKKLSDITATTVTDERNQAQGAKVQRWYPGHTYKYTFTITKKKIENVTCTVADWVTVTGENTKIDLES